MLDVPKQVYQLVHTLSYGDAISGEVLALDRACQELGIESAIYAINEHHLLKGKSKDYHDFPKEFSGTVIMHYSLGSPLNELYLSLGDAERMIVYHNLTPPHFFENVNPRVAKDIEVGARELPELLKISDKIISDSKYNASEIENLGFSSLVLDLPIDPARWELPTNSGIAEQLQSEPILHLLHVGRLAPNKSITEIIKVCYFLNEVIKTPTKLWLSGIDIDTEVYSFACERLTQYLGLEDKVKFLGCFADEELKALYENASVYLCLSEHEGFCLPVIEAMHFGLPVVAYESSALPDTIADAGLLIKDKDLMKVAIAVNEIYQNQELRADYIAAGKKRVAELSYENFKDNLQSLLAL